MTEFPLDSATAEEALARLMTDAHARGSFFLAPEKIDRMVKSLPDLERLHDQACELFRIDRGAALKLMFHIFFQTPFGFGMHHVYDSIGLHMEDAMNDDVRDYIGREWQRHCSELNEDDRAWWRRECAAWLCPLP